MISIIITAYRESVSIGKAIEAVGKQISKKDEIIVVAPDYDTLEAVNNLKSKYSNLRTIKDHGEGKPSALNLAVPRAKGNILILTDGDVYINKEAINNLVIKLSDPKVGAISGKPVSINSKRNMLGYWAYVLTDIADSIRKNSIRKGKRIFCSGYLFAIRKNLFPKLPEELLSEDGYISNKVYEKGLRIEYSPQSEVYVKYPTSFSDWIKQKKRSAGGYNQIKKMTGAKIRSFKRESKGAFSMLKYITSFKEFFWLLALFIARIYLWIVIYRDINIKKKSQKEIWKRVESTK